MVNISIGLFPNPRVPGGGNAVVETLDIEALDAIEVAFADTVIDVEVVDRIVVETEEPVSIETTR